MKLTLAPDVLARLERHLAPKAEQLGQVTSDFLKEKLSQPGGGVQHPGLPNPSSAPGEYPAEQSGALLACIGHERVSDTQYVVGALNSVAPVPVEAWALEYPSPPNSPVDRQTSLGARPWASKALGDVELHDRIRAVVQR